MSSVENFSQSVRRYGLHKQIAHGSVHGETYDVIYEETDQPAHSEPAHQYSDQSLRNRMYLLQSLGLTKCLVRRAKTRVNLRSCTFR